MKIWNSLAEANKELSILKFGSAVTIGNFDGVHRGHQAIIRRTVELAGEISGMAVVLTFNRHTESINGRQPRLLNQPSVRRELLAKLGVPAVLEIDFNPEFAAISPEFFFHNWLVDGLGAKAIVIGHDFRFGSGGRGDLQLLRKLGSTQSVTVEQVPPVIENGVVISSSRIRQLVSMGKIESANQMLGHAYEINGEVVTGEQRGRNLGFPTANIHLAPEYLLPAYGVYLVCLFVDGQTFYGVANVGVKPTFGVYSPLIEVHLLDTTLQLYHNMVKVRFLRFIRPELKFSGITELKKQINHDIETSRKFISELGYEDFPPENEILSKKY